MNTTQHPTPATAMPACDEWGRPLMQPGDGHSAWSCNNRACTDHPDSLYGNYDDATPTSDRHPTVDLPAQMEGPRVPTTYGTELCQWFALCTRPAAGTVAHPILGDVPTCATCADRHELDLRTH